MKQTVVQFLKKHEQELIGFAQQLIQIRSVNGNEAAVAACIADRLSRFGIKSKLIGKHPSRKSILSHIGKGKKTLLINGHLDTVAEGDTKKWKVDPFKGTIIGNKLYGRGACDMKGSIAAAVYAGIAMSQTESVSKSGKISLLFNYDEENGTHTGIKEALRLGISADAAICAEPMGDKKLRIGARGIYRFELITFGTTGHTGYPEGMINSVTKMAKLLLALERLKLTYTKHPLFDPPHITPGTVIHGGIAINIFPEECRALVDCRLSHGQTKAGIIHQITNCLTAVTHKDPKCTWKIQELGFVPPLYTDPGHPFVQLNCSVIENVYKYKPSLGTVSGVTDGNFLIQAGIPTVIYGVLGKNAHTENEYIVHKSLLKTALCYCSVSENFIA